MKCASPRLKVGRVKAGSTEPTEQQADKRGSAQRAPDTTDPFPERTVLLPGSPATYEHRAVLGDLGLRWDPENHRWHGSLAPTAIRELREKHGLVVRCFGSLDPPGGLQPPAPFVPPRPVMAAPPRAPISPARDSSRTRAEARVVYRDVDEDAEEIATPTRRFSLLEITSGLPDDSLEGDEREAERRLRDLRGRVKAARAVIAGTPGLVELLTRDWRRAAWFYARFGVTEELVKHSVPAACAERDDLAEPVRSPVDWVGEGNARADAVFPERFQNQSRRARTSAFV